MVLKAGDRVKVDRKVPVFRGMFGTVVSVEEELVMPVTVQLDTLNNVEFSVSTTPFYKEELEVIS